MFAAHAWSQALCTFLSTFLRMTRAMATPPFSIMSGMYASVGVLVADVDGACADNRAAVPPFAVGGVR